jgi:hypothetical protein
MKSTNEDLVVRVVDGILAFTKSLSLVVLRLGGSPVFLTSGSTSLSLWMLGLILLLMMLLLRSVLLVMVLLRLRQGRSKRGRLGSSQVLRTIVGGHRRLGRIGRRRCILGSRYGSLGFYLCTNTTRIASNSIYFFFCHQRLIQESVPFSCQWCAARSQSQRPRSPPQPT